MPTPASVAAFALLSFALIVVPGPSVMFIVGRAVALGRRAALLTVLGNAAGVYVQVVAVAAGLGAVVQRSVAAFTAVKLIGAAYLVWLGVRAVRHARDLDHAEASPADHTVVGSARSVLIDGFVVGVANPKAIVFFAAILPQYVDTAAGGVALQMAVLGLVFVAIALLSDGAWGLAAGTARDWFARSPRRMARLSGVGGLTMVGLGVHLAATGRAD